MKRPRNPILWRGIEASLIALFVILGLSRALAQISFVSEDEQARVPYVACKAWFGMEGVVYATADTQNDPQVFSRFKYYAQKFGKEQGRTQVFTDCDRFTEMAPSLRQSYTPGYSYYNSIWEMQVQIASFPGLPEGWSTRPVPGEAVAARPTAEEIALDAKANADAYRKRAEAEAARKAELARIEAERQRKIDAIAQQLGPTKRAEAERLQRMNEEIAALRPKSTSASKPRQCTQRQGIQQVSSSASTREAAEKSVSRSRATPGGSESILSSSVGGASCIQRNMSEFPKPPVGTCLACISEWMATNYFGWVRGQGYPPPKTEWVCTASVTYTAERCGKGESKVLAQ